MFWMHSLESKQMKHTMKRILIFIDMMILIDCISSSHCDIGFNFQRFLLQGFGFDGRVTSKSVDPWDPLTSSQGSCHCGDGTLPSFKIISLDPGIRRVCLCKIHRSGVYVYVIYVQYIYISIYHDRIVRQSMQSYYHHDINMNGKERIKSGNVKV